MARVLILFAHPLFEKSRVQRHLVAHVPPDPNDQRTTFSDFITDGRVVHTDVLEEIYAEINELYGTDIPVPGGE